MKSPLQILSFRSLPSPAPRSFAPLGALLLCGLLSVPHAQAETYKRYHVVADNIPARGGFNDGGNTVCPISGIQVPADATATRIDYTAYDIPGATTPSVVTYFRDATGNWASGVGSSSLGTKPEVETNYFLSFSHGRTTPGTSRSVGLACHVNPLGTHGDPYLRVGETRYTYTGIAYNGPTELIYSNAEEDYGYFQSLPTGTDVNNSTTGPGFTGFATPKSSLLGISRVYLSLQNPNGTYWNGSAWVKTRTQFIASKKIVNQATGRVAWSKIGGWPTYVSGGIYVVRVVATEGTFGYGPGIEHALNITVSSNGGPRSEDPSAGNG